MIFKQPALLLGIITAIYCSTTLSCVVKPLVAPDQYQDVFKDLCYGPETWAESVRGPDGKLVKVTLEQNFDYYPLNTPGHKTPLVIWGHPNESTKALNSSSDLYDDLVNQARTSGFSFISLEFRHPVRNDNINPVPHYDFAKAIQFIRANAKALNIDQKNIFLVGQSRGTLGLWTALQPDMAISSGTWVQKQSTLVNAVFGYQAQTTYDGIEFAHLFIIEDDQDDAEALWKKEHKRYKQFRSAIKSVDITDPPVYLRYKDEFVGNPVSGQVMRESDQEHYPDMGSELCNTYADVFEDDSHCKAEDKIDPKYAFKGYINFFKQYIQ